LFEKQQNKNNLSDTPPPPKSNKYGEVKKCPNCGAVLKAFTTKCSECGHEITNIAANNSVKVLSEKLEKIETEISKIYEEKYNKISSEREEKKHHEIFVKQVEIIKNFPVPSTKEDVLEFLFFIAPKAQEKYSKKQVAWATKFNEVLMKSKILFANDKELLLEIKKYEKNKPSSFSLLISKFNSLPKKTKGNIGFWIFFFLFFTGMALVPIIGNINSSKNIKQETNRLESILKECQNSILNEDLYKAEILANELRWNYSDSRSKEEIEKQENIWDKKRNSLLETIEKLKEEKKNNTSTEKTKKR